MKLNNKQEEALKTLFGADLEKGNEVIAKLKGCRGHVKVFKKDEATKKDSDELLEGTTAESLYEKVKTLKGSSKKGKATATVTNNEKAVSSANQLLGLVGKLEDTTKVNELKGLLTQITTALDGTEGRLKEKEIKDKKEAYLKSKQELINLGVNPDEVK